jgi:hypothetical protein
MEMPEGWAKLANEFNPDRLAFAMQLMKEMAEALHSVSIEEDLRCEDPCPSVFRLVDIALKNFKEWK